MVLAQLTRHPLRWLLPIQAALLFTRLDLLPIWGDEQFTLDIVALPWDQIGSALAADIHPPLYFALLKAWMALSLAVEPIVWARLFSAVVALGTTLALDRLWLRGQSPEVRGWFLALWCLSPLLLLDARMARSYSLQALLAVIALAATVRALARPTPARAAALGFALAALLYTHYLPGIAIGAVAIALVGRSSLRSGVQTMLAAGIAYLPWLPVLLDGVGQASAKEVYRAASNAPAELVLRLGYWFMAFSFGEVQGWITLGCAAVVSPLLLRLLYNGAQTPTASHVRHGLMAAPIGLLGTWRWVAFAFTPARLLFLLAPYLLGLASGAKTARDRYVLSAILALNAIGVGLYFAQDGFLNQGYLVPYQELARQVESLSAPADTLVLVDALNGDPKPLSAALDSKYAVIVARDDDFVSRTAGELEARRPSVVWRLGSGRESSQGPLGMAVTNLLRSDYQLVERKSFLPFSSLQRTFFKLFSGEEAPIAYYVSERWQARAAD